MFISHKTDIESLLFIRDLYQDMCRKLLCVQLPMDVIMDLFYWSFKLLRLISNMILALLLLSLEIKKLRKPSITIIILLRSMFYVLSEFSKIVRIFLIINCQTWYIPRNHLIFFFLLWIGTQNVLFGTSFVLF